MMIISRTPFRISFFGGGTDYPAWFEAHGGAVLATTIDKYCYISCRYLPPFFQHRSRIVWSRIELVNDAEEIQHPAVREVVRSLGIDSGIEIHHDGDLPARSGIGSSSSFTVGLLHALYALKGVMPGKARLAREAIHVEQARLYESVGVQDQIVVAHGGLQRLDIRRDGEYDLSPLILPPERLQALQDHLMLFFSGVSRTASDIAAAQVQAIPRKQPELTEMQRMVDTATSILAGSDDLTDFGRLLHEAWLIKRSLTEKISTPEIDAIYKIARKAGAIGGKLLGAGGGGFVLFFVAPDRQALVRDALRDLLYVPFRFDTGGSQIIYYDPQVASG